MRDEEPKLPVLIVESPRITDANSETIKILDKFVEQYYAGDLVIDLKAFNVRCGNSVERANLGQFLTISISNYVITKSDLTPERRNKRAGDLLSWMTHARGLGFIKDSESALTKLATIEVENKRLRDNQQKLEVKVLKLTEENKELHECLSSFDKKIGGIEDSEQ